MNSVNKKILILLVVLASNVFSQSTLQQQFYFANELYNKGQYFDAITELKRLQFFDKENTYAFQSNLLIGKSYKAGAKYYEAVKYFTLAEMNALNAEDYFSSKILNARTNILRRANKQAERILYELEKDSRFDSSIKEINYWQGWNYIFSDEWEKAFEIFSKENLDTTLANLSKSVDDEMYNEDFAKYSSYIIPGLGQYYSGEFISGTISLGWNILFGYLTVNAFVEDRVFDGFMIGNLLWLRFYSGNIQNAEKIVVQKNQKITNKALDYLHLYFTGNKP